MGRPHKEIATLVVNPRTGKPIDDVTLRLRFPEELCQAKAKVSLILGTSLLGKAKAGTTARLGCWLAISSANPGANACAVKSKNISNL